MTELPKILAHPLVLRDKPKLEGHGGLQDLKNDIQRDLVNYAPYPVGILPAYIETFQKIYDKMLLSHYVDFLDVAFGIKNLKLISLRISGIKFRITNANYPVTFMSVGSLRTGIEEFTLETYIEELGDVQTFHKFADPPTKEGFNREIVNGLVNAKIWFDKNPHLANAPFFPGEPV